MKITKYIESGNRKRRIVQMDIYLKPEPKDSKEAEKRRSDFISLLAKLLAAKALEDPGEQAAADRVWE